MDAYPGNQANLTYSDEPPILIAASSDAAAARAERTIAGHGGRIAASLSMENAPERIERQGRVRAVWIEVDCDCGRPMDALLSQVNRDVADGRYPAIISTTPELLDLVSARIDELAVEVIVNADDAERMAALAIGSQHRALASGVHEAASDRNAERLRQLSEEVSRIASTLARLSVGPSPARPAVEQLPAGELPPLSADMIRNVIRARRTRARYFSEEIFADPAWDMLLDLLQAEIAQLRVPVSSLCIAAAVPATTALRWLKTLVSQGLFVRRADPHDGRRVFVELAPDTSLALRRYFAEVGSVAVI